MENQTPAIEGQPDVSTENPEVQEPQTLPEGDTKEPEPTLPSEDTFEMPEKFKGKSPEEIARAYVELEKMRGKDGPKESTPEPQTTPQEQQQQEPDEKGVLYAETVHQFITGGEVNLDEVAEKLGVQKEELEERLEFEQFKLRKAIDNVAEVIGGMDEYIKLEKWASENLSEEELQQFGSDFASSSPLGKKALLKDLYARYKGTESEGQELIEGNPPKPASKGYTNKTELDKDMSDPRYGVDRAYTQLVEAKVAATPDGVL